MADTQDTELEPCPCCGAEAEFTSGCYNDLLIARVSCTECIMSAYADSDTHYKATLDELEDMVVKAWNNRSDCATIERIVRDAILGYGEMFRAAPNDESEAELKARAEAANIWLARHGFAREEIAWTKEEASEL